MQFSTKSLSPGLHELNKQSLLEAEDIQRLPSFPSLTGVLPPPLLGSRVPLPH